MWPLEFQTYQEGIESSPDDGNVGHSVLMGLMELLALILMESYKVLCCSLSWWFS
jgi:hypothetical protein